MLTLWWSRLVPGVSIRARSDDWEQQALYFEQVLFVFVVERRQLGQELVTIATTGRHRQLIPREPQQPPQHVQTYGMRSFHHLDCGKQFLRWRTLTFGLLAAVGAAEAWVDLIEAARSSGRLHLVALSGERVTRKFFSATVKLAAVRGIDFSHVHFFWADERCVPPDDAESNFRLAEEALFHPGRVPAENIHRIPGELEPDDGARRATGDLRAVAATTGSSDDAPSISNRTGNRNLSFAVLGVAGAESSTLQFRSRVSFNEINNAAPSSVVCRSTLVTRIATSSGAGDGYASRWNRTLCLNS